MLISNDIPTVSTQAEVDELLLSHLAKEYCSDYLGTVCFLDRREKLETLWEKYEPYADTNFHKEIKETNSKFQARTWEMCIANLILENNLEILNKNGKGPDFKARCGDKIIWIEVTAPDNGQIDGVPEKPDLKPGEIRAEVRGRDASNRPKIIRLLGAILKKDPNNKESNYHKYKKYINDTDCYVIAVSAANLKDDHDSHYILRAICFAKGCKQLRQHDDYFTYAPKNCINKYKSDSIAEIELGIFNSAKHSKISAIIFAEDAVTNIIHNDQKIGDNLWLVKNPFADNTLPDDFPIIKNIIDQNGNYIEKCK